MDDIEIGMNIVATLHLHIMGAPHPTAFEVKKIVGVSSNAFGTEITYEEYPQKQITYLVEENESAIEEAIKRSEYYRDKGLRYLEIFIIRDL